MAGVGEAGFLGDVLNLQPGAGDQEFLSLADTAGGEIFIGGTVQKTAEGPGEILGSNVYLSAEGFHSEFPVIMPFNFFYYRGNVTLIKRIIG